MEPVVYILAIMGCHEGTTSCEPMMVMPTHYQSAAACDLAAGQAIHRPIVAYGDFPMIVAQCLKMEAGAAELIVRDAKQRPAEKPLPEHRPTPWTIASARG
jgi:hypothetical protein